MKAMFLPVNLLFGISAQKTLELTIASKTAKLLTKRIRAFVLMDI